MTENQNIILEDTSSSVKWNTAIESLVKEQGEKALAYSWLHTNCEKKYSRLNNYIALPCIALSTFIGSASIASNQLGDSKFISIGIGLVSIFVGVLSTINSYFAWAKRAENHRISSMNYSKLYLFISFELSMPREKRIRAKDFIKVIREQIERLNEISPQISDDIIMKFRKEFDGKYENVSRPEITNGLIAIRIYGIDIPETMRQSSTLSNPSVMGPPPLPMTEILPQPSSPQPPASPIFPSQPQMPTRAPPPAMSSPSLALSGRPDVRTIMEDMKSNIYHL